MLSERLVIVALRWRGYSCLIFSHTLARAVAWFSSMRSTWPTGMPAICTRERAPSPVASSNIA